MNAPDHYDIMLLLLLVLLLAGCDRGASQAVPGSGPEIHLAATTVVKAPVVSDTALIISLRPDAAKKSYSSASGGRHKM